MLRTVLAAVIAAHGIGHVLFLVPLLGLADWDQPTHSWLLHDASAKVIGGLLWVAAMIAFGVAVVGLLDHHAWWRGAAIVAASISTAGLILFWPKIVSSPVISALVVNGVILGALLIAHWPSADALGA